MRIAVGAKTDVGLVREGNEDSYLVEDPVFVVADGMGGAAAGDIASSTAVDVIARRVQDAKRGDEAGLRSVVHEANSAIWERSQGDPSLRGMGTTCTLLVVAEGQARLAHVGDSRAYLFRGGELRQLTEDHTLVGHLVREGRLSAEDAAHHPQRSVITRALGVDSDVDVDTMSVDLEEGDRLLICSDGLSSMVPAGAIADVLAEERDPERAAERLVQLALDNGGEDNVTVVLLDVVADGRTAAGDGEEARARDTGPLPATRPPAPPAPPEGPASGVLLAKEDTVIMGLRSGPAARASPHAPRRRRWGPRIAVAVVLLALVAIGGFFLVRSLLNSSYFVGVDEDGDVTLFRGIPDEIAGFSFREVERETDLSIDDLPEFLRDDVSEGMRADSLAEAEDTIANLEERAEPRQEGPAREKNKKKRS